MSVQVEKLEKNTAKMTVEVPVETFLEAINKVYLKQKKNIAIPGFRKGKAPKQIIEKMYGEGVFFEEAADMVLMEEYPKAAQESGLKIITRPDVEITQIGKDKPFVFTATVAIYPEVILGEYKGVEIEKAAPVEVTDEEIEEALKHEQESNARIVTVEDRPAQMGDTVVIDYKGTIDGVAFDGGADEGHRLELGSNSFIPGFEDQLVGVSTGEDKDVNVTFPEEYPAKDLAGKAAVFACKVHKIEKKELPEIDDEFAQEVSEFDTLAEYKEDIKKVIEADKSRAADNEKMTKAVDKAVENSTVELPDILIDETVTNMVKQTEQQLSSQGLSLEQYLTYLGQTPVQFKQAMVPQAIKDLKSQFVLEKIAEVEGIEATEEAFEERIEEMAKSYGTTVDQLKKLVNEDMKKQMMLELVPDMAAKFVSANAVEK